MSYFFQKHCSLTTLPPKIPTSVSVYFAKETFGIYLAGLFGLFLLSTLPVGKLHSISQDGRPVLHRFNGKSILFSLNLRHPVPSHGMFINLSTLLFRIRHSGCGCHWCWHLRVFRVYGSLHLQEVLQADGFVRDHVVCDCPGSVHQVFLGQSILLEPEWQHW